MNDHSLRIIQIMKDKKMSATQFSEAIGIQRANISHITLGRNNPTADVITKIINRFEDINPGWLLNGKGTMKIVPNQPNETESHLFYKENLDDVESKKNVLSRTSPDASGDVPSVTTCKPQINTSDAVPSVPTRKKDTNKEGQVKKIEKIVIFFSDKTYETFSPDS